MLTDLQERARALIEGVALDKQATKFDEEAAKHERSARQWLASAGCFALATVAALLFSAPSGELLDLHSGVSLFLRLAPRIGLLLVFLSGLVVSLRQFRVGKHNAIVNRHRANALHVFRPIAVVAGSERARDIVITQATGSIFRPVGTGIGKESDMEGMPAREVMGLLGTFLQRPGSGGG